MLNCPKAQEIRSTIVQHCAALHNNCQAALLASCLARLRPTQQGKKMDSAQLLRSIPIPATRHSKNLHILSSHRLPNAGKQMAFCSKAGSGLSLIRSYLSGFLTLLLPILLPSARCRKGCFRRRRGLLSRAAWPALKTKECYCSMYNSKGPPDKKHPCSGQGPRSLIQCSMVLHAASPNMM